MQGLEIGREFNKILVLILKLLNLLFELVKPFLKFYETLDILPYDPFRNPHRKNSFLSKPCIFLCQNFHPAKSIMQSTKKV